MIYIQIFIHENLICGYFLQKNPFKLCLGEKYSSEMTQLLVREVMVLFLPIAKFLRLKLLEENYWIFIPNIRFRNVKISLFWHKNQPIRKHSSFPNRLVTQSSPKTQFIFQKRLDFKIFMNSKSVIYFYLVSMSI